MAADNFLPGDVVKLKSGGPFMTIDSFTRNSSITKANCVWFLDERDRKEATFSLDSIKKCS